MPMNRAIIACALIACAAALTPRSAPEPMERISFMRSPVLVTAPVTTSSNSGHATLERQKDGHYWANADVKGMKLDLLVDTGASMVTLTDEDARRLGIPTHTLDYAHTASTANGEVKIARLTLDRMRVGGVTVKDVPTMVTKGDLDTSLLGMSFLGALASFEFKGDTMIMRQ